MSLWQLKKALKKKHFSKTAWKLLLVWRLDDECGGHRLRAVRAGAGKYGPTSYGDKPEKKLAYLARG